MTAWLTQKDVEDYGHDVLDLAQRAALHATASELQRIHDQNEVLRQQLAQEQRRGLYRSLDTMVPNWREIDRDPRWLEWLRGRDVLSGEIRQRLLDEAIARGDARRVINFFQGFLQTRGRGA